MMAQSHATPQATKATKPTPATKKPCLGRPVERFVRMRLHYITDSTDGIPCQTLARLKDSIYVNIEPVLHNKLHPIKNPFRQIENAHLILL
jgi:hypothetical protein